MLSHCANSECSKPFLKLREGKLFLVQIQRVTQPGEKIPAGFAGARQQQRTVEHFWLCDECARRWTLIYDREQGVRLLPLPCSAANGTSDALKTGAA